MGSVVVLHLLTAIALVMVKTPVTIIEPLKVTPPIEIQLVSPTIPLEEPTIEIAEVKPVKVPKPQPAAIPDTKPKPTANPKATAQPVAKKETPKPKVDTKPTTTTKVVKSKPVIKQQIKSPESDASAQADALAADNERKMLAAQAERATQEAHAKAMRDAQAAADAKAAREAQAVSDAKAAQEAAQAARAEADAAARAKAAEKVTAAASNTPVNFTATNANWASSPGFSFPARAKRGTRSGNTFNVVLVLQVNKQGGIDSVRVAQSSGHAVLDREAQQQVRSGRFKPFTKNGVAVVGNVTLPISYAVP